MHVVDRFDDSFVNGDNQVAGFETGPFGHWKWLIALGLAALAVFAAGYWLFDRLRDSFAEVV